MLLPPMPRKHNTPKRGCQPFEQKWGFFVKLYRPPKEKPQISQKAISTDWHRFAQIERKNTDGTESTQKTPIFACE